MPEDNQIYKAVLAELVESVEDHQGSRTVTVEGQELGFKYRNGICTVNDAEGEPFVQYKVTLERIR